MMVDVTSDSVSSPEWPNIMNKLFADSKSLEDEIKSVRERCSVKLSKVDAIICDVVDVTSMARFASTWLRKESAEILDRTNNASTVADQDVEALYECRSAINDIEFKIFRGLQKRMAWIHKFVSVLSGQLNLLDKIYDDLKDFAKGSLKGENAQVTYHTYCV
jgi:hypothetical protein